jgi:hypothetical protein
MVVDLIVNAWNLSVVKMYLVPLIASALSVSYATAASPRSQPFRELLGKTRSTTSALQVDLGYGIYEGSTNRTSGINIWRGYERLMSGIPHH